MKRIGWASAVIVTLALAQFVMADTWDNSTGNSQWSYSFAGLELNWADNSEPTINDPVVFPTPIPQGLPNITLSTNEVASTLTFNDNYTLTAGTLNLGADVISVANGKTATFGSVLVGSGGLTKSGNGTLIMNHPVANTFVGPVTITDTNSTLTIKSNLHLGDSGNAVHLNNFARLRIDGSVDPNFLMSRVIWIDGAAGGTIEFVNNPTVDLNAALGATANPLTLTGTGTLELGSASSRTGSTFASGCTLRLQGAAALGSGNLSLSSGATLELTNGITFDKSVTLGSNCTMRGGGGLVTYAGSASVSGSSTVNLNGGPLTPDTLQLGTVGSAFSGASGALTIVGGAGTVRSDVANSYAGNWQIDSGTLRIGNAGALGTGTSPIVLNLVGALYLDGVTFNRPVTMNDVSKLTLATGSQFESTATVNPGAAATIEVRDGVSPLGIAPNALTGGTAGSTITVTGNSPDATLQLQQPSDYVGNWTLASSATVEVTADENLGDAANTVSLAGGVLQASAPLALSRTIIPNGGTLSAIGPGTTLTLSAPLFANSATLRTAGDGTVVLTAESFRTGETYIDGGTLRVTEANALGTNFSGLIHVGQGMPPPGPPPTLEIADVTLSKPMVLDTPNATVRGTGANATTNSTINIPSGRDVRLESGPDPADTLTIAGPPNNALTGGGGQSTITVDGAGRVVLTGSSNYNGDWIIVGGTLAIDADNQLGANVSDVWLSGGTLSTTAAFSSGRVFTADGGAISPEALTTLTLNNALANTGGSLTKNGPGTLILNAGSLRTGATTINAGTVSVSGTTSGLGSGNVTINNTGMLELNNATHTSLAGGIILNVGGLLRGFGNSAYSSSGFPAVDNGADGSPVFVGINVPGISDVLTIQSAFRDVADATPSFATVFKQGNGTLILQTGGTGATDIFSGSWGVDGGILQIGPNLSGGEVLNALGFKNSDPRQANTVTVSTGTLAVGTFNSVVDNPDFLRANVILSGGSIASTNGIDAKYGGDFKTTVASFSRVLLFDPAEPATIRNVSLVAGAEGVNNLAADTVGGPGSTVIVDPGTTSGGAFNIMRDGGTVSVVGSPTLQVDPGATVNLGGTLDALSDGVDHVNILNNSTASLNVIFGSKNVGDIDGSGNTTIDAGATLAARSISQNTLTVNGTAILRLDDPGSPGSATSTVNQLDIAGTLGVTLAGATPGTDFTQLTVIGNANLSGTLDIALTGGFEPSIGQSFVIMTFGSRTGTFTDVTGLDAGPGKVFQVEYNASDVTLVVVPLTGDMNCDGTFDELDIEPFVLALTDFDAYEQQFSDCDALVGDFNSDLELNGMDIGLFVECLINGACP